MSTDHRVRTGKVRNTSDIVEALKEFTPRAIKELLAQATDVIWLTEGDEVDVDSCCGPNDFRVPPSVECSGPTRLRCCKSCDHPCVDCCDAHACREATGAPPRASEEKTGPDSTEEPTGAHTGSYEAGELAVPQTRFRLERLVGRGPGVEKWDTGEPECVGSREYCEGFKAALERGLPTGMRGWLRIVPSTEEDE